MALQFLFFMFVFEKASDQNKRIQMKNTVNHASIELFFICKLFRS